MKWSLPSYRAVPLVLGLVLAVASAAAQALKLPLEYRHLLADDTKLNYQSVSGVPISQTEGTPPGSNGLQPNGNESTGVFVTPTPGQFRGFLSLGAIPGLSQAEWIAVSNSPTLTAGTTTFGSLVAEQMRRPRAVAPAVPGGVIILRQAWVGMPYLARQVSFAFGQVITPPAVNESGGLLGVGLASSYWLPEPYTTNGHTNSGYYWSPHAQLVYAIQPGPVQITWVKASPYNATPSYTNVNGTVSFRTNGANIFLLYTEKYVVSGSAIKPPRKMYWTEKSFQNIGRPVRVPTARVGAVNIVYNNSFPRTVDAEFDGVGNTSPTEGSNNNTLKELRTLWFDQQVGNIYAYNAEGRVFVELLGDLRQDGQTYQQLGTEIVDVSKQAIPEDVTIELGERIVPPVGGSLAELYPEPLQQGLSGNFAYQRSLEGATRPELYAIRETFNLNDYLIHWMEDGEAGLQWPKLFGRYRLAWPQDVARYSHYIRPPATTDAEAAATAVKLEPENAPNIEYQDALDRPRAKFTPDFKFYTWLDAQYPVHRTLLRYVSGENVAFERVFSWYAGSLRETNFVGSGIAGDARRVITNLTAWNSLSSRFERPAGPPT